MFKKKQQIEYIATQDIPIFGISKGTIIKYEKAVSLSLLEAENFNSFFIKRTNETN